MSNYRTTFYALVRYEGDGSKTLVMVTEFADEAFARADEDDYFDMQFISQWRNGKEIGHAWRDYYDSRDWTFNFTYDQHETRTQ